MKPNKPSIIGITGGIATGKSTASNIIKELGYKVIDGDLVARQVVEKGKPAYEEIVKYFGDQILDQDGNINRKKLGHIVFNDEKERKRLNNLIHPHIMKKIKQMIDDHKDEQILFLDIPLLIEEKDRLESYSIFFDQIWLIYVDEKTQIQRLMKRDGIGREEALKKIRAQMPIELKKEHATKVIDNRKAVEELREQIRALIEETIRYLEV